VRGTSPVVSSSKGGGGSTLIGEALQTRESRDGGSMLGSMMFGAQKQGSRLGDGCEGGWLGWWHLL
jgi:hypothetical protein